MNTNVKIIETTEAGYMGFVLKTIDIEQAKKVFTQQHGYEPKEAFTVGWNLYVGPVMKLSNS